MIFNVDTVCKLISEIPFVYNVYEVEQREISIEGKVHIVYDELGSEGLHFGFSIYNSYPLKVHDSESIKFNNIELLKYKHVMPDGGICIHTSHSTNFFEKLVLDFQSLKVWIDRYYLNGESDTHYEHIIAPESDIGGGYYAYHFTDCEREFLKDEFGTVLISQLRLGYYREKPVSNNFVQRFVSAKTRGENNCMWSALYKAVEIHSEGIYCFMKVPPAKYGRIGFDNWTDLIPFLSEEFLKFLHIYEQRAKGSNGRLIPIFLGYNTIEPEIHWQVIMLKIGEFPLEGVPERVLGRKTGNWKTELRSQEIKRAVSRNCSYDLFFGRGVFHEKLTNAKIMIIGIGAVGSIVAKTLTRGGCKFIDIIDYDVKEAENVCRSEYTFMSGFTEKTAELQNILCDISPFANVNVLKDRYLDSGIKMYYTDQSCQENLKENLNFYDLILDCSTDNDLMFVLNKLKLETTILNLSITNHAKEMIGAFYPNMYRFVNNQFSNVLHNDVSDLYSPTGCWSPTFKASYNDINVLVQLAMKHLNKLEILGKPKSNFVIQEIEGSLKVVEF